MGESIGRVQALLDQPNSQLRNRLHQLIHTYLPHKNDSESVSLFRGASMLSTQQIPAISSTDPFLVNTDYLDTFVNEQCRLRTGCSFFNSLPLQRPQVDKDSDYLALRQRQNRSWAISSVESGNEFAKNKQMERALKAFQHAVDIDPTFTDALVAMASCLAESGGQFEKAVETFERALELEPTNKQAYDGLMGVLDKMGKRLEYSRNSVFFERLLSRRRALTSASAASGGGERERHRSRSIEGDRRRRRRRSRSRSRSTRFQSERRDGGSGRSDRYYESSVDSGDYYEHDKRRRPPQYNRTQERHHRSRSRDQRRRRDDSDYSGGDDQRRRRRKRSRSRSR